MMRAPYFSLLLPPPTTPSSPLHPNQIQTHAAVMAEDSHGSSGLNDDSGHNDGHCNAAAPSPSFDILLLGNISRNSNTLKGHQCILSRNYFPITSVDREYFMAFALKGAVLKIVKGKSKYISTAIQASDCVALRIT